MGPHSWPSLRPTGLYKLTRLLIWLLAGGVISCSQGRLATKTASATQPPLTEEIFTEMEEPPSFPGGAAQLEAYIRQHIRYPQAAHKKKVQGNIVANFVVTKEGQIRDVQIRKGLGVRTNQEIVHLLENMPAWNPGKQNGRLVNAKHQLTIPYTQDGLK